MAIVIDENSRIVVQGLTGREGSFHAQRNRAYGTNVVGGVTPGKGGQDVEGIPVFDTVRSAVQATNADVSLIFVPPRAATDAIYEAADAGLGTIVVITEGIPAHDMLRVFNYLQCRAVTLIGPNCPGVISPGKASVGIMPTQIFMPGPVGIVSRSGTLTYQIANELTHRGIGQSSAVGIGGDPIVGSTYVDILALYEADPETQLVVMVGEIGGRRGRDRGALCRRAHDQAGGGLRRGLHRSARQADGPRGSHHLGVVGNRARQEGGDGGRGHARGDRPHRRGGTGGAGACRSIGPWRGCVAAGARPAPARYIDSMFQMTWAHSPRVAARYQS